MKPHLEPIQPSHSLQVFNLIEANREELSPVFPWMRELTLAQCLRSIEENLNRPEKEQSIFLGIFLDTELIGTANIYRIDWVNMNCEIGGWLGGEFQGHGYALQAAQELIQIVWEGLDLHRIEIRVPRGNSAALKVTKKLGFKKEGILKQIEYRKEGGYSDQILFSLIHP
jgi:ribosomal-protein-serine acetyltransferase